MINSNTLLQSSCFQWVFRAMHHPIGVPVTKQRPHQERRFERMPLSFRLGQAISQGDQHAGIKPKTQVSTTNVDIFNIITVGKFHGCLPGNDTIPSCIKRSRGNRGGCAMCCRNDCGISSYGTSLNILNILWILLELGCPRNGLPMLTTWRTISGISRASSRAYTPPRLQPTRLIFSP